MRARRVCDGARTDTCKSHTHTLDVAGSRIYAYVCAENPFELRNKWNERELSGLKIFKYKH